jgi:hypothetical protein
MLARVFKQMFTLPFPSGTILSQTMKEATNDKVKAPSSKDQDYSELMKYQRFIKKFECILDELRAVKIDIVVENSSEMEYAESGLTQFFVKEAKQYN